MEYPHSAVIERIVENKKITERPMKIYEETYHDINITIVELEHALNDNLGATSLRPTDWEIQLETQITSNNESLLFPEYCMPDLERRVFSEPGIQIANPYQQLRKAGIVDFYSKISKLSGQHEKHLYAADIANSAWYEFYNQLFYDAAYRAEKFLNPDKIDEKLLDIDSPGDARHVILARGIMQEVLRQKKPILHINAPNHSIWIDYYIKRQIKWEGESGVKIEKPIDLRYVSSPEELRKMKKYSKLFPLDISVREYMPILPPIAYDIDDAATNSNVTNQELMTKIQEFSELKPKGRKQKIVAQRILELRKQIENGKVNDTERILKPEARLVMTDRFGWKLVKTEKVY